VKLPPPQPTLRKGGMGFLLKTALWWYGERKFEENPELFVIAQRIGFSLENKVMVDDIG